MAVLELNIDALEFPEAGDATINNKGLKKRPLTTLVSKIKPQSTSPRGHRLDYPVPKGHLPEQWIIFQILNEFLQPGSGVSLQDAADNAVAVFAKVGRNYANMRPLNDVCIELAEQIPYHHPAQLKLARLLWVIGRSSRQSHRAIAETSSVAGDMYYQNLWEDVVDNIRDPGDDKADPARFVNFQAFMANLYDIGVWISGWTNAAKTLNQAFSDADRATDPAGIRDAWVLGAAQWILWYGQSLFKQIIYPEYAFDKAEGEDKSQGSGPRYATLQQWANWKAGFRDVIGRKETGDECSKIATKVVEVMGVLEKGMSL